MTPEEQSATIALPVSVHELAKWTADLPHGAVVEATTYNSYKKSDGRTKIQRLIARWGPADA